jgi:hypothetical protein
VTVVADGYGTVTQLGADAQYQAFLLTREVPRAFDANVTVNGLDADDAYVLVQVGDAWTRIVHDGADELTAALRPHRSSRELPVWVMTQTAGGEISRIGRATLSPVTLDRVVDVAVAITPVQTLARDATTTVTLPSAGLDSPSAQLDSSVRLFWLGDQSLVVGSDLLEPGVGGAVHWTGTGDLDEGAACAVFIGAVDAYGARSTHLSVGDAGGLNLPSTLQLLDPSRTISPTMGGAIGTQGSTLVFEATAGSSVNAVEIRDTFTGRVWTLWTPGLTDSVTLPVIQGAGLVPERRYHWRIISYVTPGYYRHGYQGNDLTRDVTDITTSWWEVFDTE